MNNIHRKPLVHAPTASFTMKREEFKRNEDLRLITDFASWLTKITGVKVEVETFEEDLLDGIALCRVMSKIRGSGLETFHETKSSVPGLEMFKAKENLVAFQLACKNLNLPISFGSEDLEKKNITRIISALVFMAHVAHSQGLFVKDMEPELLEKVEQMDEAIENQVTSSWFQQLLVKLGLGEWIAYLSVDSLKAYLATLKKNIQETVETQKTLIRQQSETFHGKVLERTASLRESLPESLKTRIIAN